MQGAGLNLVESWGQEGGDAASISLCKGLHSGRFLATGQNYLAPSCSPIPIILLSLAQSLCFPSDLVPLQAARADGD